MASATVGCMLTRVRDALALAIAVGAATAGFILGMSIAVVTGRPLF